MAVLPNAEQAIVDLKKLEAYCLNPGHFHGRHKALVFSRVLGLDRGHPSWLRSALLEGIRGNGAVEIGFDANGRRWRFDVLITRGSKVGVVRTIWIVRTGELAPCWVL